MNAKTSTWVGGTVVLSVLVAALAWFLALSPTLAAASTARADTETAEMRNVQLQAQLTELEAQAATLGDRKNELAVIQRQIPTDAEISAYVRTLQATAESTGVTIVQLDTADPESIAPAAPPAGAEAPADPSTEGEVAADAATTDSDGTGDDAAAGDTAPAAPSGPQPVEGFTGVQLSITVVGNPAAGLAFLNAVQVLQERLFLVTDYDAKGLGQEEASGGRPATAEGDMELMLTGYLWVLPPLDGSTAPATPETGPALPPLPGGGEPRLGAEGGGTTA